MTFSEQYGRLRQRSATVREAQPDVPEELVQAIWYDQLFHAGDLKTAQGTILRVLSPGWWNRSEGPDFRNAQIEFAGELRTGDIEVHLRHGAWREHGHHLDHRYNDVMLEVVLERTPAKIGSATAAGTPIPCLLLGNYIDEDLSDWTYAPDAEEGMPLPGTHPGQCAGYTEAFGVERAMHLLALAGEWRLLTKARRLRERMERAGTAQAVYEQFLQACGYSRYKHHFTALARSLPYDRVRQLALRDPALVEAAFLHLAGLLPKDLPEGTTAVPHFARLRSLRRDELPGLKRLPLEWKRTGVRPNNYPERRLAGACHFLAHTAPEGLVESLDNVWRMDAKPIVRRRAFESLFGRYMGFWSTHCTWHGKKLAKPVAPLGSGRVQSIIGNVFVPTALALARLARDRTREETILRFFSHLPQEPKNAIIEAMVPRFFGDSRPARLDFRTQQGLLQLYHDWCEPNPSCRNCTILPFLDVQQE